MDKFSIKQVYNKLRGVFVKVDWRRLTCNNCGCPKWVFILQLVMLRRIYTKDRLARWGLIQNKVCSLCEEEDESIEHLFFECTFSNALWTTMLRWMGLHRAAMGWQQEVTWAINYAKGQNAAADAYRLVLGAVFIIYGLRETTDNSKGRRVR
ncbi:uncharacterized protein LOC132053858 [Lycium ferocissimum]|uniref:uncharacterized protein LOC132053858 n=1 Tax=Lycium ferocissimum TaxID=112874 RepID=UPI002815BAB3|nr:uncharacterized protein LOC132053858 [Lycium ferocissimum]